MKLLREFQAFASRGNVIDMAVGVMLGTAFGKIITSFVDDVLMPPLGMLTGKVNFSDRYLALSGQQFSNMAEAQAAGVPVIAYGVFVSNVLNFFIIAFSIFLFVRQINKLKNSLPFGKKDEEATTKNCPFCLTTIPALATRCSACTSQLES